MARKPPQQTGDTENGRSAHDKDGEKGDFLLDSESLDAQFDTALKALEALDPPPAGTEPTAPRRGQPPKRTPPPTLEAILALEDEPDDASFLASLGDVEPALDAIEFDPDDEAFLEHLRQGAQETDEVSAMPELGFGPSAPAIDESRYQERIADLEGQVAQQEGELSELKDKQIRQAANFDNARKRLRREKQDAVQFGNEALLKELLPVIDNLKLALEHAEQSGFADFVAGVRMVYRLMLQSTSKFGLEPFDSEQETFDPRRHQAISQLPSDEVQSGLVLNEIQRGYLYYERLLRAALVTVSSGPLPKHVPQPEPAEEAEATEGPEVTEADGALAGPEPEAPAVDIESPAEAVAAVEESPEPRADEGEREDGPLEKVDPE